MSGADGGTDRGDGKTCRAGESKKKLERRGHEEEGAVKSKKAQGAEGIYSPREVVGRGYIAPTIPVSVRVSQKPFS